MIDNSCVYHEVDFLLPAQRFKIQFSYVSKKGLPFMREFVLRLVHVAPMSKSHIATYFGLSRLEAEEAVSDLVQRGELTLSQDGRLTLTDKAQGYFTGLGETPTLSTVQDSGASLTFDLASFSCIANEKARGGWKAGMPLKVDDRNVYQSEKIVEVNFQQQFNQILDKGFLPSSVAQEGKDNPYVYTVKSVDRLKNVPVRLKTEFEIDASGGAVERKDYDELNSSENVHELISFATSKAVKKNNLIAITKSMFELGDEYSLKVFDEKSNVVSPALLSDLEKLEEHLGLERSTFIGPVYSKDNWSKLQKYLAPLYLSRVKPKESNVATNFIWIAPSDAFWGKSDRFISSLSDFINRSKVGDKTIYHPKLYLPILSEGGGREARRCRNELDNYHRYVYGLAEGFLDGNVEILYLEGELVVVVYHVSNPDFLPVSIPLGFFSKNKHVVNKVGGVVDDYVSGFSSFDNPNDLGPIADIGKNK